MHRSVRALAPVHRHLRKVPQRQPKRARLWINDGSCIRLRPQYPVRQRQQVYRDSPHIVIDRRRGSSI